MQRPQRGRHGFDLVVIGGGVAGLTAAVHGIGRGFATALLEREAMFGGQVATVERLEGLPLAQPASGVDLATAMVETLRAGGVTILPQAATAVSEGSFGWQVATAAMVLRTRSVVVATGCRPRLLDVLGEKTLCGRGVSHCASCDGPLFRGEEVVVAGGGDAALQEALALAAICGRVTIVARGRLRARRAYLDRAASSANIRFIWDSAINAIRGEDRVMGVELRNVKTGEVSELDCAGVFAYLGGIPNSEILPQTLARDEAGFLLTDAAFRTRAEGIYAVGSVRSGYCGELATAAGEAAAAVASIVR